jgi:5'-nucleotidase
MIFDTNGDLIGFEEPQFHVFNKRAAAVLHTPYFVSHRCTERKNVRFRAHSLHDHAHVARVQVLLFGDSLGDVSMTEGLHPETVLRVGFLNDKVDERLQQYLQVYDVVILGDGDLRFATDLLRCVCGE